MNLQSFFKMSYGLYVISATNDGKNYGCIVNTLTQVTAEPPMLCVAINKNSVTTKAILESGKFCGVALTQGADMNLIGTFGFKNSEAVDKFSLYPHEVDENGIPYLTVHTAARYSCQVVDTMDLDTHYLIVGKVLEAQTIGDEPVMTYDYYHRVIKGGTPPTAPSYKGKKEPVAKKSGWRCTICGYIYEGETLPEGYVCPVCGVGADLFEKL